jgi:2,4-dienoyl-CoA reductase-like NADH-dependent reductase (Old Yellow Enzyme family)
MSERFPRVASLRTTAGLRARLAALALDLPCDDEVLAVKDSPLARPLAVDAARVLPNRFVIQPMEGWDGSDDGLPSALTRRRWRRFGASGAAWVWGGEAVAVRPDGRANAHQLVLTDATAPAIGALRRELLEAAAEIDMLPLIGLQLTHSGRWSRPHPPRVAFRHPLLDTRIGVVADEAVLSDGEVDELVACFARAARLAQAEGFDFVDLKHCHGYLAHEFLAARSRRGRFGGASLAERTGLLCALVEAVRLAAPGLAIGVRLSVFDLVPYRADAVDGIGAPESYTVPYQLAFGADPLRPDRIDLEEALAIADLLRRLDIGWLNVTAGSPYYTPHIQRPAAFPPSDGYLPPEDPLVGVARLLGAARTIKAAVPELIVVSSGWSYLQEFIPHVAQACVRAGWCDAIGLGRVALSYPNLPRDALAGHGVDRRRLCRTFSDCTTAPRNGLVSGCYPLDDFYRHRPEYDQLARMKRQRVE